jgi:hypothetical protein
MSKIVQTEMRLQAQFGGHTFEVETIPLPGTATPDLFKASMDGQPVFGAITPDIVASVFLVEYLALSITDPTKLAQITYAKAQAKAQYDADQAAP